MLNRAELERMSVEELVELRDRKEEELLDLEPVKRDHMPEYVGIFNAINEICFFLSCRGCA